MTVVTLLTVVDTATHRQCERGNTLYQTVSYLAVSVSRSEDHESETGAHTTVHAACMGQQQPSRNNLIWCTELCECMDGIKLAQDRSVAAVLNTAMDLAVHKRQGIVD